MPYGQPPGVGMVPASESLQDPAISLQKQTYMKHSWMILLMSLGMATAMAQTGPDAILGTWKATEKVLTIEVYKHGPEYKARIVSFTDHHSQIPSERRMDEHNPDKALQTRKVIGIDVLTGLAYNAANGNWTGGRLYDVSSGKMYSAILSLEGTELSVRVFKGISLLGKTLTFRR